MPDVYGRAIKFGNALSSDGTRVTFDEFQTGFLVQTMNLQYSQRVSRIFELASETQYFVVGRPEGQMGMARIIGPQGAGDAMIKKFGDACKVNNNTLQISGGASCSDRPTQSNQFKYTTFNVLLTMIGLNVSSQDMLINQQMQLMFVGLSAGK